MPEKEEEKNNRMAKDRFKPADRYANPKPSVGGWLGIGDISASDVIKYGAKIGINVAKAAGDPFGTTINIVKSLPAMTKSFYGTVTRLDDYGALIKNNQGGKYDARRLNAYTQIQGKGLEDLSNLTVVLGAFKAATSPIGRNLAYNTRHSVGQMDVVGQPIRTAILKSEVKNLAAKSRNYTAPDPAYVGSTQVRNIYDLHSPEAKDFGDAFERYGRVSRIKNSPNLIERKLLESQDERSLVQHPIPLYEKIREEGLDNLPPAYLRFQDGRALLSDGHHRIISANKINPKMPATYEVDYRSLDPLYNPKLTPADKIERAYVNTRGRMEDRKRPPGGPSAKRR